VLLEGGASEALKSGLAGLPDPLGLAGKHQAVVTPIFIRSAYTVAMVVLRRRLPNPGFDRSAQKLRFWVPVALRAPAPGQPERWASMSQWVRVRAEEVMK
jgi:hypothetical protein